MLIRSRRLEAGGCWESEVEGNQLYKSKADKGKLQDAGGCVLVA